MREFTGIIQSGQLTHDKWTDLLRRRYFAKMKDGEVVLEQYHKQGKPKTNQQVKTHWGLVVGYVIANCEANDIDLSHLLNSDVIPPGTPVTKEAVQAVLYAACNTVGDEGERKTLSQMTTAEASAFFELCRNFCMKRWEIEVPNPDPNRRQV